MVRIVIVVANALGVRTLRSDGSTVRVDRAAPHEQEGTDGSE